MHPSDEPDEQAVGKAVLVLVVAATEVDEAKAGDADGEYAGKKFPFALSALMTESLMDPWPFSVL